MRSQTDIRLNPTPHDPLLLHFHAHAHAQPKFGHQRLRLAGQCRPRLLVPVLTHNGSGHTLLPPYIIDAFEFARLSTFANIGSTSPRSSGSAIPLGASPVRPADRNRRQIAPLSPPQRQIRTKDSQGLPPFCPRTYTASPFGTAAHSPQPCGPYPNPR